MYVSSLFEWFGKKHSLYEHEHKPGRWGEQCVRGLFTCVLIKLLHARSNQNNRSESEQGQVAGEKKKKKTTTKTQVEVWNNHAEWE